MEVSLVDPPLNPQTLQVASESRRFVNFFVDSFIVQLLVVAFSFFTVTGDLRTRLFNAFVDYPFFPIISLVPLFYYVPQEFFWGRTLGKFITGTKVVSADGVTPTLFRIVGRTLCRMIPFEWFTFLETSPVGWHDKFSGTRVVMARSTPTANP
jgi:uncharacterized RDD family membrane protein YckC